MTSEQVLHAFEQVQHALEQARRRCPHMWPIDAHADTECLEGCGGTFALWANDPGRVLGWAIRWYDGEIELARDQAHADRSLKLGGGEGHVVRTLVTAQ